MLLSGAEVIIKILEKQGVDTMFGYPGGTILPFYDALYAQKSIKHVLTVHEQGAAHAADGYARATGKVGVCVATSGPGATNLVTGLAAAFLDSVPVIAITGQVALGLIGRDAFQEIDITGVTIPVTKHNYLVKDVKELPEILNQAFYIARSGRPGPVLIDVPRDIQAQKYDFDEELIYNPNQDNYPLRPVCFPDMSDKIAESARYLTNAKQPVILAGGGVISANASKELASLVKKTDIPVVSTLMGIGAYPSTDEHYIGMTGLHGHKAANNAVLNADVLMVTGSRFNDRITGNRNLYAVGKTIIHVDIDLAEIKKNISTGIGLVGNMTDILKKLGDITGTTDRTAWRQTIREWQQEAKPFSGNGELSAPWVFEQFNSLNIRQNAIFVTDVGQHQMWAAQYLKVDLPRTFISSGGLGAMGFGLPAAIGAQAARSDKRIVHIAGDGGFKMTGCELYTAASQKLPVISIIINNSGLGMIRQLQHLLFDKRFFAADFDVPMDFTLFAKSFGVDGYNAFTKEEFSTAFNTAWEKKAPALIVANVAPNHMVSPMIALDGTLGSYIMEN
jgi:acetolactate synthase-1/2/3 large subunit